MQPNQGIDVWFNKSTEVRIPTLVSGMQATFGVLDILGTLSTVAGQNGDGSCVASKMGMVLINV